MLKNEIRETEGQIVELSERRKRILRTVVESYIATAEPIGSKTIAEQAGLTCSSATIRNELAALEKLGLLEQPHTSSGRIPTASGYRFYVNELMEQHKLSMQETQTINSQLHLKMQELDRVIDQAGRMVSQLTNYPAFAMTDRREKATITRFDLLMVDQNSFIIVVMTNLNVVKNKLVKLPVDVNEPQLQLLNTLLNTSFVGKTAEELNPELMRMAEKAAGSAYGLISLVVSFAMEVLEDAGRSSVHTAGANRILEHSEYQDVDKAHELLSYLDHDAELAQLPGAMGDSDTKILIGPENVSDALKNTSVVMASYDIGEGMRGVIGVVGPTRMDYAKVTARLNYFAESLSKMFGKGEPEQLPGRKSAPALQPPKPDSDSKE
ncbi:MAG: heat-inducible transcriptional repressor HrcA [Eubacteriales bacterium]|nr:heat-inducible transcriptional repressor HrcA [Eubacteriales bacterium]